MWLVFVIYGYKQNTGQHSHGIRSSLNNSIPLFFLYNGRNAQNSILLTAGNILFMHMKIKISDSQVVHLKLNF